MPILDRYYLFILIMYADKSLKVVTFGMGQQMEDGERGFWGIGKFCYLETGIDFEKIYQTIYLRFVSFAYICCTVINIYNKIYAYNMHL